MYYILIRCYSVHINEYHYYTGIIERNNILLHIQMILSRAKKLLIREKLNCRNSDKQFIGYKSKICAKSKCIIRILKSFGSFAFVYEEESMSAMRIMLRIEV